MLQLDSAHQIGPETTLQSILIVVESGGTVGKTKAGGIFHPRKLGMFYFYLNNQRSYGQIDATGGFSASNWSKNNPPRCSDSS